MDLSGPAQQLTTELVRQIGLALVILIPLAIAIAKLGGGRRGPF